MGIPMTHACAQPVELQHGVHLTNTRCSCQIGKVCHDEVRPKAAEILPLVGLAKAKQDLIHSWAWCSRLKLPPARRRQGSTF